MSKIQINSDVINERCSMKVPSACDPSAGFSVIRQEALDVFQGLLPKPAGSPKALNAYFPPTFGTIIIFLSGQTLCI